jgi:indole-3-glycerol phosphate synthase
VITVAESGIRTAEEARQMRELGYDAVLVGEALVKSKDPSRLIAEMRREKL